MKPLMIKLCLSLSLLLFLVACGTAAPETVEVTRIVTEQGEVVEVTRIVAAAAAANESTTLLAIKVDEVVLDGNAAFWADAPLLRVPTIGSTEDRPDGPTVRVQAAYDDNAIVIRAEWADPTESLLKNAWTWDGTSFTKSGNEDRIMINFPIGSPQPEFASKGCAAVCHNMADDEDEWWVGSEDPNVRYDMWHWKSARTHPFGQADDKWWSIQEDPNDVESSRHGDAKESGGDTTNVNEEGDGPAFMHGSDLTSQVIFAGQEVPIDTSQLSIGDIVPGYILEAMVGSRGDISAQGVWADGRWVVVMMRELDTGHDDDVVFVPPRPYPFGLSIIDDGGGLDHTNAPEVLTLEWEQ